MTAALRIEGGAINGPLAVLEAIDWSGATDCYGPVEELPSTLRATLSEDDAERREALEEACDRVYHQRGVCDAAVRIVPFLAQAALAAPADRWRFLDWLAESCGQQDREQQDRTGVVGRIRAATLLELPALLTLVADPDPRVRRETLKLIAAFPYEATAELIDITGLTDPDPRVRSDLLTVVADLRQDWPGVVDWLTRALDDEDAGVRYQAARLLMAFSGTPYPTHLVEIVGDWLAEHGRTSESANINIFCGVPGYTGPAPRDPYGRFVDPLTQDPDATLYTARRILGSGSSHADYAMILAKEIEIVWRGREREATALAFDAFTTVTTPRDQYMTLRWILRMLSETPNPDHALLGLLEDWGNRPEPDIASTAWAASARIDPNHVLDRLRSVDTLANMPLETLRELCGIYGPDADCLVAESRRRLETMPLKPNPLYAEALLATVLSFGERAAEFLPLLSSMLEREQALYPLLEAIATFGPMAADNVERIKAIADAHALQHVRLRAARAHRALTGDHGLARRVAADVAGTGSLEHDSIAEVGLLGPDAMACTAILEEEVAKRRYDGPGRALWRITGDRDRFAPIFAQLTRSWLSMIPAVEDLLEIGTCPDECRDLVARYADSPRRIVTTTRRQPLRSDDYLLQRLARELLDADRASGK